MTVELVTGHAGVAHVSPDDAGHYNAGVIGSGRYVLNTGSKLACEVQSANLVTIGTGDAIFDGRHVRVSTTENVEIDNGAQGLNRNDIICLKYEYNSGTTIESASIEVIKGTAVSGTPTDPTIPSGNILNGASTVYMPLWRLPIEGITVGTPVKMYGDVLVTLNGMATRPISADQITSGTLNSARIPNLAASKITSGTLSADRIPSLAASKIGSGTLAAARIPNLDASKITSGTFASDRIPSLNTSKLTAGTLGAARGGTGKTYGYTWQQLGTSTGTTAISFSLSGYSEVMIACYSGTKYLSSTIIPVALLSSTAREVYLGGGVYDVTATSGRYFGISVSTTKATPAVASVDGSNVMGSSHWYVFAR